MPVHQLNRNDLRVLARMGDLDAAVQLAKRARVKTLKGLICQVCEFEAPLTPAIFDCCADAWALVEKQRAERPALKVK